MSKLEYYIADHYLPSLVNGDSTGLSDEEESELARWIAAEFTDKGGNWIVNPTEDHDEFYLDAVSGLYATVTLVEFIRIH